MGFLERLLGRKKQEILPEEDWEEIVYDRESVDFSDKEQRDRYVTDCLEQMADASGEVEAVTAEYNRITSYLKDMEEIEALPGGERESLEHTARILQNLERDRSRYLTRNNRMKDSDFYQMRNQEAEIEEGIAKLREAEKYAGLIKHDLKKIDRERQAYAYRKQELSNAMANFRGMAIIFLCASVVCFCILALMQFVFEMNAYPGFFIAGAVAAISLTVLCVKYLDYQKEWEKVLRASNRLVQLQNKVKIRYVNNSGLLDYLYIKYQVDSADKLAARWKAYQQEKEERKQYAEAEAKIEYYQKQLVAQLSRYPIHDPDRWMNQVDAILDAREMVEIRHELILQRQSLRKKLDYNQEILENARKEIMDLVETFPAYAEEIMELVGRYE